MPKTVTFRHFIRGAGREMERLVSAFNDSQSQVTVAARRLTEGLNDEVTERMGLLPPYLGNSLPDVVMVYAEFVATLADQGRIHPVDEFMCSAEGMDASLFVEGVLDTVRYRDRIWALPIEGNPYALCCNRALLERAGVNALPQTWGDVFHACAMLTADTDGDGHTDRFGYAQSPLQVPLVMWQFGAELVSEDLSQVSFDSEEGVQALKCQADLRMYSSPHAKFEHGDIGMKMASVEDYLSGRYDGLDYTMAPLPRGRRAANSFGGADSTLCLVIACRRAECARAAWRFLRWFTTQAGAMAWARASGAIPLVWPVLESEEYQGLLEQWPQLRAFVAQMAMCRARPCIPEYPVIKWALNAAVQEACRDHGCSSDRAREILRQRAADAQAVLDRRVRA